MFVSFLFLNDSMGRQKKQQIKTIGCIACGMRQRTIEKLNRILSLNTSYEEQHVFLQIHETKDNDTLIYDPSHRIYQHFVKQIDTYEQITVEEDVYSLHQFQQFLQQLSSSTIDNETMRFYECWNVLFQFLDKKQSFWCSIRFEELFGFDVKDQPDVLHRSEKRKKLFFHFTQKPI